MSAKNDNVQEQKVLYLVEHKTGRRWHEWVSDYEAESSKELGYIVEPMHEKNK